MVSSTVSNNNNNNNNNNKAYHYEFGGPFGALLVIVFSNLLLPFFWYYITFFKYPWFEDANVVVKNLKLGLIPEQRHFVHFGAFFLLQLLLALIAPGFRCSGLKIDKRTFELAVKGKIDDKETMKLPYLCNGYFAYYFSLALTFGAHFSGYFDITIIAREWGQYMIAAMIFGNLFSVVLYFYGLATEPAGRDGHPNPSTLKYGHFIYDIFMGTTRYPRIGIADIKMIAEARWSWLLLFIITSSCAIETVRIKGYLTTSMAFMLIAHWLYSNATVKGEQYIITTWDMVQEKFGWMLCFWNIAGVPFMYCLQSLYLLRTGYEMPMTSFIICVFILLLVYYMWDTSNGQKADFKAPGLIRPYVFPNFGYSHLNNPQVMQTPHGPLLLDGWFVIARKLQYTGDILFALLWGISCGFDSWIPYYYFCFFTTFIYHRYLRDEEHCKEKYGQYWEEYKKKVPYVFIPYVY